MAFNWSQMRNSFGWNRGHDNGLTADNPQHQANRPFPPSSQPFPPSNGPRPPMSAPTPPNNTFSPSYGFQQSKNTAWNTSAINYAGAEPSVTKKQSLPPTPAQMNPPQKSRRVNWVALLVSVFIAVAVVSAIFVTSGEQANAENNNGGNGEEEEVPAPAPVPAPVAPPPAPVPAPVAPPPVNNFELFPTETRTGNDYVGVLFLVEPSVAGGNAFIEAARRWSDILAGSEDILIANNFIGANQRYCNGQPTFNTQIAVDHLRITATIEFIDGPFNVLGSAGPCAFRGNRVPTFGSMRFDSEDIDRMERDGSLTSVILHEMGHVLGIGTIMFNLGVAINQLPGSQPDLNRAQPEYIGSGAVGEFRVLTGQNNDRLFLENGFTNNVANGAGGGSVNGHWDQDDMQTELMTFRIQLRQPALSRVTIAALNDMGYNTDITRADNFVRNNFVIDPEEAADEVLVGDVEEIELLEDDAFPEPIQ